MTLAVRVFEPPPISAAAAAPIKGGSLTSGKPVVGKVSTAAGIAYTFTAVAGEHVTLAITDPKVAPTGDDLQMQVYDASGATDTGGVYITTSPTEIDFTPIRVRLGELAHRIHPSGALWIAWPRRAGGHDSDITDTIIRACALPLGIVDVKVAAIDADWSGQRYVWRMELRSTPTP
jgi:hypothetical protein